MGFGDHGLASRSPLTLFRDHDSAAPLDLRFLKYGGMPADKKEDGRYSFTNAGDWAGAVFWAPEPNGGRGVAGDLGQWWYGALSVDREDGLRVVLTDDEPDKKLKPKKDVTREKNQRVTPVLDEYRNTFGHTLPIGTVGTLMQSGSQDEFRQWFLPSLETVAHHNGIVPRGDGTPPECSTRTFDLTPDGALDWDRAGGWHSHIWNAQLPKGGPLGMQGDWVPAWNLARSAGDATGYGAWVSVGPIRGGNAGRVFIEGGAQSLGAFASHLASGPLHPGELKGDKHFIGAGETTWNAGHISTKAYFFMDKRRDAPLAFELQPWPYPNEFAIKSKVHLVYRDEPTHEFVGGDRQGLWDWYTTVPVRQPWIDTPGIPKLPDPPTYQLPPRGGGGGGGGNGRVTDTYNGGIAGAADRPQNAGGGFDQPNPYPAGQPLDTSKTRIDPARTPYEMAMPSLYFFPVRNPTNHPYDGRFGGPPVDTGPQGDGPWSPDGLKARGLSSPVGDPVINIPPIPIPPLGGSGFPPGITGAADAGEIGGPGETFSGPLGFQNRATDRKKYEADQARAWTNKPLAFHMQAFAKVSGEGWSTNTNPGDEYLSGTADGGLYVSAAEPLLDGNAPPSVSLATMVFASENQLGTNYSGKAARLAFGTVDWTTGTVKDGFYIHATGASGSVNGELRYLDASGAARVGTTSHYGVLVGAGTGSNVGLGKRTTSAVTDTATDLLTVATDNQSQRYTFAEKVGGYTANIDLDTTGAVEGATFELDLELAVVGVGNTTTVLIRNGSGGSTLATVTSAISGAIKRWCKAYYNGSAWVLTALVANLT